MATLANQIVAALDAFFAKDDGTDEETLSKILERFEELSEPQRIVPALFAVMERNPSADLGAPGPLVHSIETLPVPIFEPLLRASLQRRPCQLNVWMVNRILNSKLSPKHRKELLALLKAVTVSSVASAETRQTAEGFLQSQAERRAR